MNKLNEYFDRKFFSKVGRATHASCKPQYSEYKYKEKADEWFGLCMSSKGPKVRFGVTLSYLWTHDRNMDERTCDMFAPMPTDQVIQEILEGRNRAKKVGRNDPCPCGSGLKYKKCCLN